MYPLAFVREAAQKIGAPFYMTTDDAPSPWAFPNITDSRPPVGSMLPFQRFDKSETSLRPTTTHSCNLPITDHPTVSSWVIEKDGSLLIRQASILASSTGQCNVDESTVVNLAFQHGMLYRKSGEVVLSTWIKQQSPLYNTHLICLSRDFLINKGVILQGLKSPESAPTGENWTLSNKP